MEPTALSPRRIRRGMNLSIWSAVLGVGFGLSFGGAIFTGLLRSVHLTNPQIGIMMSIPLLFPPLQIFGVWLQRNYFDRKRFWFFCSAMVYGGCFAMLGLVSAWFKLPVAAAFPLLLGVYCLIQIFMQLPASTNLSWLGELVPARDSNSFWNRRTGLAGLATMAGGILMGKLIDVLGVDRSATYVIALLIGSCFGIVSTLVFAAAPDPDSAPRPGVPLLSLLSEIRANREYRILTMFFSYQSLFAWISSGFIFFYLQDQTGMNFSMLTIQVMLAVSSVVAFVSGYFFRVVGSRYGRKPVLILCSVLKAVEFVLWGTMLPHNGMLDDFGSAAFNYVLARFGCAPMTFPVGAFGVLPVFILGGFVNMGIPSSQMSLLTSLGNKRIQGLAIALFSAVVGICGVLTGSVAGYLYNFLAEQTLFPVGELRPFNILALVSAIGYCTSVFFLRFFKEEGAAPTANVVRMILSQNPIRAVYQAHLLSQPMSENDRVEMLQRSAGKLTSGEIGRSLYNPSSRVRDGALLNLSTRTGEVEPELIGEVIRLLDVPELGMQAMAARTLGRLRCRAGVPALLRNMESEDLVFAQACVFALGQIEDPAAAEPLRRLLVRDSRRELRPMAAEALSKTGDWREAKVIFPVFASERSDLLRFQCLIALVRVMLPDGTRIHAAFEEEELNPGSELERVLKTIGAHPQTPGGFKAETYLEWCDAGKWESAAADWLTGLLQIYHLPGVESPADCFLPGGRLKHVLLREESYHAENLRMQLELWLQLKYNAPEPEEYHLILLAILLAGCAWLEHSENSPVSGLQNVSG